MKRKKERELDKDILWFMILYDSSVIVHNCALHLKILILQIIEL